MRALSNAPVSTTADTRASVISDRPMSPSGQGKNCSTSRGTPASHKWFARCHATPTVSGAGLRITLLPAMSAAVTPPQGMAYGKFQGGVITTTPSAAVVTEVAANAPPSLAT